MNERIKQLAKQAGINLTPAQFSGVLEDEVDEFTLEKFAELIVRECAESLWTEECHNSDLALEEFEKNSKKIRKHFGVE
jgi:hypothetical protein